MRVFVVVLAVAIVATAGVALFRYSAAAPSETASNFAVDFVVYDQEARHEWRRAATVSGGERYVKDLGVAGSDAQLRLSLRSEGARPRVRLYPKHLQAPETFRDAGWTDLRVPCGSAAGERVLVEIECRDPFFVAQCDLVQSTNARGRKHPNVLVVVIDALRADHLGCYGYTRDTSPNIDRFADGAVRFTDTMAQTSWTRTSVASILSGSYAYAHRVRDRGDGLSKTVEWLPETLNQAGYKTLAVVTNPNLIPLWGFHRGFDLFVDANSARFEDPLDAAAVDEAIHAIQLAAPDPWFLYLHLMGPHDPYAPPGYEQGMWEDEGTFSDPERQRTVDLYDAEIRYSDREIGRLFSRLRGEGLFENALIIVTSDHGEEFWDHGGTHHGKTLYQEQLHIPFIMKLPGGAEAGAVRDELTLSIDAAPTILDAVGLAVPERMHGESRVRGSAEVSGERAGYASLVLHDASMRAARRGAVKYLRDYVDARTVWYDLSRDPREREPSASPPPGGEALPEFVSEIAAKDQLGLNILVTNDGEEPVEVRGKLRLPTIEACELRYPEQYSDLVRANDETVEFSLFMPRKGDDDISTAMRVAIEKDPVLQKGVGFARALGAAVVSEQDNARLQVETGPYATGTLELRVSGVDVSQAPLMVGDEEHPLDAELEMAFNVSEITADPERFFPAALPRQFAIYIWYVPTEDLTGQLPPEAREALEGLGYLN